MLITAVSYMSKEWGHGDHLSIIAVITMTACGSQRCPRRVDRLTWVMASQAVLVLAVAGTRALYQVGSDYATVSFVTRIDSLVSCYLSVIMTGLPILSVR